jgi:hypothetical protein
LFKQKFPVSETAKELIKAVNPPAK